MKRLLLLGLALLCMSGGRAGPPAAEPVLVRFGPLLWVYGEHGLPRLDQGRVLVPLAGMCDLFSARCALASGAKRAEVGRTSVAVWWPGGGQTPYARLSDLAAPLGYHFQWDPAGRTVDIARNTGPGTKPNRLSRLQGDAYGFAGLRPVPVPLQVTSAPGGDGRVNLSVTGKVPQARLTLFAQTLTGSVLVLGSHGVATPDLPKQAVWCSPEKGTCQENFERVRLALAVVETP